MQNSQDVKPIFGIFGIHGLIFFLSISLIE